MRATSRPNGQRPWIIVGPIPPVLNGVAFITTHVLEGMRRADLLAAHLDTSDLRPAYTTNRLDVVNAVLGLKHTFELIVLLIRHRDAQLYVPVAQGRWGFLRDTVLIALARLARRPVTLHLNGGLFDEFYAEAPRWEQWLIRRVMDHVDNAWVLTEAHIGIFDGLIPRDRVSVLENTSEDVRSASLLAPVNGDRDPSEGLRILFLSNLFPSKGCFDLIDALESLGEGARGISLRLVGEAKPEWAAEVERRAAELAPLGIHVEYGGTKVGEEKYAEYFWADVFSLPSWYPPEGQPLVLLEAMSAGLPIVASDHSGIPWTVRDGKEGLIVPAKDIEKLAEALARMRDEPELRAELSANARRRYEDAYSNAAFYEELEELARAA